MCANVHLGRAEGELIQLCQVHSSPENDVAFHPGGNFLVTGGDDDTITLLDLLEVARLEI
ncbi:PREDICTED: POC1 centriolar protein homolog [Rhagoletis zephyria]|uniref:POC1 centriolar protein homolog n=1 Tax=Rhagoletis zephyria TaxID=28612 RepID=UPI000811A94A|nr:PREDICTED: POC1 centriolar protein homolog [Rhagoletis zephyria]